MRIIFQSKFNILPPVFIIVTVVLVLLVLTFVFESTNKVGAQSCSECVLLSKIACLGGSATCIQDSFECPTIIRDCSETCPNGPCGLPCDNGYTTDNRTCVLEATCNAEGFTFPGVCENPCSYFEPPQCNYLKISEWSCGTCVNGSPVPPSPTPTPTPSGGPLSITAQAGTNCTNWFDPLNGGGVPLSGVDLRGDWTGIDPAVDSFSIKFDCNNDGIWEREGSETPATSLGSYAWRTACDAGVGDYPFAGCTYITGGTHIARVELYKTAPIVAGPVSDIVNIELPIPTLTVSLAATPPSGPTGFTSNLSATVGGTATGTINYNFWWNCANLSNSVATVEADPACGVLSSPPAGSCASNSNGYKCLAVNANPQTVAHAYTANSMAKVIVERSVATPTEARTPITITNGPPTASAVTVAEPNYCSLGPSATISWTYSDPESNPQSAYQVQIDDTGSAWNLPVYDSGKVLTNGTSTFITGLLFNVTYKTRVRVWDSFDLVGNWAEGSICNGPGCIGGGSGSWKTPKHAYPAVNFTWSPLFAPAANQPIQFTDLTTFYDDSSAVGQRGWEWLFGDNGLSTLQNPTHTYASPGSYNVTEIVFDKDGYQCVRTKPLNIQRPIPVWKEVSPK